MIGKNGATTPEFATTAILATMALKGTIAQVAMRDGETWAGIAIIQVRVLSNKGVAKATGVLAGSSNILTYALDCVDTGTGP
jgi:hypothetical protein